MRESGGFSLIEMLVASVIGVVLLSLVGGFVINMTRAQMTVSSSTTAMSAGQLASLSIDRAVRNSSTVNVTPTVAPVGVDQLLTATTVDSSTAGVWGCSYWYYSAAKGTIRFTHTAAAITTSITAASQASWTLLASGVTRIPLSGALPSPQVFAPALTGQTIVMAFRVATGAASTATFRNSSSYLAQSSGSMTC